MTARHSFFVYRHAIRVAPVLCLGGLMGTVAGNLADALWLFRFGASVFLSGVVVWGFANGYLFMCGFVHIARRSGFRTVIAHPWSLAMYIVLALFFLTIGAFFISLILRTSNPN